MATKKQLEDAAKEAGLDVPAGANKADLEALLANNNVTVEDDVEVEVEWFKATDTGVVFAAKKGTALHQRVTSKRNAASYEKTSKPAKSRK
ncbi:hypothetical protein [Egicoccus sp. AB-alg6-2]|uniref:hypothetical protein n=1 Tax=Egicoccus sp. AB-alg6-2 TaxID=3242692 RepID=UPI00359DF62C